MKVMIRVSAKILLPNRRRPWSSQARNPQSRRALGQKESNPTNSNIQKPSRKPHSTFPHPSLFPSCFASSHFLRGSQLFSQSLVQGSFYNGRSFLSVGETTYKPSFSPLSVAFTMLPATFLSPPRVLSSKPENETPVSTYCFIYLHFCLTLGADSPCAD